MRLIQTKSDPRVERVRQLQPFRQLGDRDLRLLARSFDEIDVAAGKVLTREGRVAEDCYVIVEGEAEVTVDGRRVAIVGPGEFVGEMALLSDGSRSATVRALTPMHLFTLHKSVFAALLDQAPVVRTVLGQMTQRLRRADAAGV